MMVTPQQRKQVVVKSIGEIERESTVRARPMGSRAAKVATAVSMGDAVGEGLSGIKEVASGMKTGLGYYSWFAKSRGNWLAIGLMYGNKTARMISVPQRDVSWVGNIPNYLFTGHVLYSTLVGILGLRK